MVKGVGERVVVENVTGGGHPSFLRLRVAHLPMLPKLAGNQRRSSRISVHDLNL